ncbi:MAG: cupredoxin domain-containing protein [Chloroflexota bacterium]
MLGLIRPQHLDHLFRGPILAAALALSFVAAPVSHAQDADVIQFAFQPTPLQLAVGTTVTWTNHDSIVHSVTHGTPDAPGGSFDSGLFDENQTFSFTFTDAGDYTYFCMRHNFMRGTISVTPG